MNVDRNDVSYKDSCISPSLFMHYFGNFYCSGFPTFCALLSHLSLLSINRSPTVLKTRLLFLFQETYFYNHRYICRSRDSLVGTATGYGLDDRGVGVRVPARGPTQPPTQCVPGSFSGSKAAEEWSWPLTSNSAEVKKMWIYAPTHPYAYCLIS
jgi:hypothetical protein